MGILEEPATHPGSLAGNEISALKRFWRDEVGTTAIEYGLIAFGISVVIVAVVNAIGSDVKNLYTNVSTSLGNTGR